MKYYLLDASAVVYSIEHLNATRINFFLEKANGEAFLYIPQFCIAEVLNTFARFLHKDKKIESTKYTKWRGGFLKAVHNRSVFYAYDLHRYHNLNADKIYRIEHKTPYKAGEGALSSLDILIIAMGMELRKIHFPENTIILTRDGRLLRIANLLHKAQKGQFAEAIWFE